mgnify:FL=1
MRIEKDALGELPVPEEAYYGIQTVRCAQNYDVTDHTFNELPHVIRAVAEVKKAAALANKEIKALEAHKADAIAQACDEIIAGKLSDQFPVNIWRSHGTGVNMNVNEVIANRANEILTGRKGYDEVHPNTHVNMCQSSNDTYPAAEAIVLYRMIKKTVESVKYFEDALKEKAIEFKDLPRLGRTCMQDAVPMTFGQVFAAWQSLVQRNRKRLEKLLPEYQETILGATVLGSGMGEMPGYNEAVYKHLSDIVGFEMRQAKNKDEVIEDSALFDGSQNNDSFIYLLGVLKCIACAGGRIGNDLYIFSSGPRTGIGEFILPSIAPGSSIMPGKINPYMPEMLLQIMQQVISHDMMATLTVNESDLDLCSSTCGSFLGAMESLELIEKGFRLVADLCIKGIQVNAELSRKNAEMSTSLATMVSALYGYPIGTKIAHKAFNEGKSCKEVALEEGLIDPKIAEELFDVRKLADRKETIEMFRKYSSLRKID